MTDLFWLIDGKLNEKFIAEIQMQSKIIILKKKTETPILHYMLDNNEELLKLILSDLNLW